MSVRNTEEVSMEAVDMNIYGRRTVIGLLSASNRALLSNLNLWTSHAPRLYYTTTLLSLTKYISDSLNPQHPSLETQIQPSTPKPILAKHIQLDH